MYFKSGISCAHTIASADGISDLPGDDDIGSDFSKFRLNPIKDNSISMFYGNPLDIAAIAAPADNVDSPDSGYEDHKIMDSTAYFEVKNHESEAPAVSFELNEIDHIIDGEKMPGHFDACGTGDKPAASLHAELNDGTAFPFGSFGEVCYISSEDNNDVKTLGKQFQNSISTINPDADAGLCDDGVNPDFAGINASNGSMRDGHADISNVSKKSFAIIELIGNKANSIHPCFLSLLLYFYSLSDINIVIQFLNWISPKHNLMMGGMK